MAVQYAAAHPTNRLRLRQCRTGRSRGSAEPTRAGSHTKPRRHGLRHQGCATPVAAASKGVRLPVAAACCTALLRLQGMAKGSKAAGSH